MYSTVPHPLSCPCIANLSSKLHVYLWQHVQYCICIVNAKECLGMHISSPSYPRPVRSTSTVCHHSTRASCSGVTGSCTTGRPGRSDSNCSHYCDCHVHVAILQYYTCTPCCRLSALSDPKGSHLTKPSLIPKLSIKPSLATLTAGEENPHEMPQNSTPFSSTLQETDPHFLAIQVN